MVQVREDISTCTIVIIFLLKFDNGEIFIGYPKGRGVDRALG